MRRPKVFVSHWMPPIGVERLKDECEVDYTGNTEVLKKEDWIRRARQADAALIFVPDTIDRELVESCPYLRVISSFGRGFDNIDVEACTERGIQVTVNPSALTDSTADMAMGLMLSLSRRLVKADAHVREGKFSGWHATHMLGRDVHHARMGIVGMGNIGKAIARRAVGFDMDVVYTDVEPVQETLGIPAGVRYIALSELLATSDYIVLATNLTPVSLRLIGMEQLALVKPGSFLINIARGSVVDEEEVAKALQAGRLAGYASDVFAFEDPMNPARPVSIPEELLAMADKTVFTPHIGTGTIEARERLAISSTDQLLCALRGERPSGAVNRVLLRNLFSENHEPGESQPLIVIE